MIEVAGKHRKDARAVWAPVRRGVFDAGQRKAAAEMTAGSGGGVWVMWGQWSRVYFAFGWWGWPVIASEPGELARKVGTQYARVRRGAGRGQASGGTGAGG